MEEFFLFSPFDWLSNYLSGEEIGFKSSLIFCQRVNKNETRFIVGSSVLVCLFNCSCQLRNDQDDDNGLSLGAHAGAPWKTNTQTHTSFKGRNMLHLSVANPFEWLADALERNR